MQSSRSFPISLARPPSQAIAIIGMACLFPKAANVDAFWRNILGRVDAVTDPPPEAFDPDRYYDPSSNDTDRIYCKQGGFLGDLARFDPIANSVPPSAVSGEPDQWLALQLARDALADAGYSDLDEAVRHRTAVILGRGATFNGGTAISVQHSLVVSQTLEILKSLHPEYTEADLEALREGLKSNLPYFGPETAPGLTPNVVVGRIANRLDLMGHSYTIDSACASSLIAIHNAVRDLANNECDLALAGGCQIWTPMPILSVFCQLNALSHREQIRPFDKDADGTILGEGLGIVVLKRLGDAERDGDRIYAVIRGVGTASDGRAVGVMAPRLEGEELALRRAYESAGISPGTVELIEAHGTGTPLGDMTEVQALTRVFGQREGRLPSVALGAVKSMISHTVQAAGAAGIIKTALALHHKTLPPTINCDEPDPRFELEKTPFYISTQTRPWVHGQPEPRRAGVSAFGFGGIDAHVVLEEYASPPAGATPNADPAGSSLPDHRPPWDSEVCILEAPSPGELLERVQALRRFTAAAKVDNTIRLEDVAYSMNLKVGLTDPVTQLRLAVVASSVSDLDSKLQRAAERLADSHCKQIQERGGVYYQRSPLARSGKLAFLFPGEGSQYENMLADLCLHFPEVRSSFDDIDRLYHQRGRGYAPSNFVFPHPTFSSEEREWMRAQLWHMDVAAAAVLAADDSLHILLDGLGVKADAFVGHSSGEWAALRAAGVFGTSPDERRTWIAANLFDVYRETMEKDVIPEAVLLAIGAGRADVDAIIAEVGEGVRIAMDNCPAQVVVAIEPEAVGRVMEATGRLSLVVERLSFDRAYHSPLFGPYSTRLREALAPVEFRRPVAPVYSCATARPMPPDATSMRDLTSEQWVRPVLFRQTIEALYEAGVRVFVEVGPRGNLTAFVENTLHGRPACAVSANVLRRSGITQLNHLTGLLAAHGVDLKLDYLFKWRRPRTLDLETLPAAAINGSSMLLRTKFPAMSLPEELASRLRTKSSEEVIVPSEPPGVMQPAQSAPSPRAAGGAAPPLHPPGASELSRNPATTHQFLNTMEQFLDVQEKVMSAYLRLKAPSPSSVGGSPKVPPLAPSMSRQPQRRVSPVEPPEPPAEPTPSVEPPEPAKELAKPGFEHSAADASPGNGTAALPSRASLEKLLLAIVSERTGYPVEAIGLDLDLEADLGIDSIKRVEIMGSFRRQANGSTKVDIERLTSQRTLQGAIEMITASQAGRSS